VNLPQRLLPSHTSGPPGAPNLYIPTCQEVTLKDDVIFVLGEAEMMLKEILLNKGRWAWLLLSAAAMFVSAYSVFGWMGAVGRISGWTGLPQYEAQIPGLRKEAEFWQGLIFAFPFLAAWLLGLGRNDHRNQSEISGAPTVTYPRDSHPWISSIFEYGIRLGLSILGTLGFTLFLLFLGMLLDKLRLTAG